LNFTANDPQVLFNLAGAYALQNKFEKALDVINKCLETDPQFPGAANLKQQLSTITKR
jgi:hypothetical protein